MDKLRALQYFIAAAEEGSFSAAARRFELSVPAVTKLVGALERELGVRLLERSTRGLALTPQGAAYREACAPLLAQLAEADRAAAGPVRARTLVVGAPALLARALLIPALPGYRDKHPHVQIELRTVDQLTVTDAEARGFDVLIALGWPGALDLVKRPLAQSRLTLVIYMGLARAEAIVQALVDGGLPARTPAAAIASAHTPRQRQQVCTLAELPAMLRREQLASPAILVVGEVVGLSAAWQALQAELGLQQRSA